MAKKTSKDQTDCGTEEASEARPTPETEEQPERPVTPVRQKIGEERGNLHRRSEWFRRRSGDSGS